MFRAKVLKVGQFYNMKLNYILFIMIFCK